MIGAPATTLKNRYSRCRLGRSDLVELFSRATGHIDAAHVTVTTEHNHTRWAAASLPDLINDVTSAPGYDSHVPWDNLEFEAKDPSGELEVWIDVDPKQVYVRVTGTNEILVHGQQARIELFLRNRGAGGSVRSTSLASTMVGTIATMVAATAVSIGAVGGTDPDSSLSKPLPTWAAVLAVAMTVLIFLSLVVGMYSTRAKLKILEDIPQGSAWSRFTPMEKATVIGIYAAVLAMVGTLASGAVDVAGLFGKK